jgi:hypothetical protein
LIKGRGAGFAGEARVCWSESASVRSLAERLLLEPSSEIRTEPGESGRIDRVSEEEFSKGEDRAELVKVMTARQRNKNGLIDTIDGRDMDRSKETNLVKNFPVSHFSEKGANTWT